MQSSQKNDLTARLDAVVDEARARVKVFQTEAESARQEVRARFERFVPIAEQIVAMARQKLEQLRGRLEFEVIPSQVQTDRFYTRAVTLNVKSDLAGVIKLGFRLGHDPAVRTILLDYDLEIIPVFFRFNPHDRLEMPLESYNEAGVAKWLDDRIVDFANAYLELCSTKQYQERAMVSDPVAGISFPSYFAAATLDHDGKTFHFISEESRREFAKRHSLNA